MLFSHFHNVAEMKGRGKKRQTNKEKRAEVSQAEKIIFHLNLISTSLKVVNMAVVF